MKYLHESFLLYFICSVTYCLKSKNPCYCMQFSQDSIKKKRRCYVWAASTCFMNKAWSLAAFCALDSSSYLEITPASTADEAWYWPKRILCSGWLRITSRPAFFIIEMLFIDHSYMSCMFLPLAPATCGVRLQRDGKGLKPELSHTSSLAVQKLITKLET